MLELKPHDPNHIYVRTLKGCGHGKLFTDPCADCKIVGILDEYKLAIRAAERAKGQLRALGVELTHEEKAN